MVRRKEEIFLGKKDQKIILPTLPSGSGKICILIGSEQVLIQKWGAHISQMLAP